MHRAPHMPRLSTAALLLLAGFLALFQLPFLSPQDNANANTRMMLTAAIVNEGTTRIDPYKDATGDKAFHNGHYYSDKAPGMALLAVPAYAAAQAVLDTPDTFVTLQETTPARALVFRLMVLSTSGLLCILAALAFYRMAETVTGKPRASLLATLTVFLGTPMLGWSIYFFGHAATGACLIAAFALIYQMAPGRAGASGLLSNPTLLAGAAGLFLGLAISIEYTAAPAVALVGVYGILRAFDYPTPRAFALLGVALLACVVALVPMMIYHTVTFGGPFSVGYSSVVGFEGMQEGFLGLTSPDPKVLYHLSFGVRRGLFWLAPVVVLVPVAMVMALRARVLVPEIIFSGLIILYYFLLNASYHYWDGGASLGPRHVTPALPFMGVALIYLFGHATGLLRTALYVAAAGGVAISVISASSTMTAYGGYMYPLWEPVLSNLIEGIGIWSFYAKIGLHPILAFVIWAVLAGLVFRLLWRRTPAT